MNGWVLLFLGFLAQGLFSARFLIQLVKSEKAGKVISPIIFWQLSLIAAFLLMVYGTFRQDVVIVAGQVIGYFVYIRNLQIQKAWAQIPPFLGSLFLILPFGFFGSLYYFSLFGLELLLANPEIDKVLLTWGGIGQTVFTGRFLIQWYQAERKNESFFPLSFWYISIAGALMIASYAIIRKDAVLFIGQGFGLIVYIRNIMIYNGVENKEKQPVLDQIKNFRVWLLIGFTALVLFFNLNSWSVTESSEARYAEISKEMLDTGDWIHPQLMGIYHYHKPPMTYWITAVSYKIFGVTPFAARFFLQISILLQIFLVYRIGIYIFSNTRSAFMSAMLYASFPVVIIGGRALTTDSYLATLVLLVLYFWFGYLKNSKKSFLIGSFLALGLGFLTKGPVVWIVPIVLWGIHLIQKKKKPEISKTGILGILLMLVIGFSWFIFLYIEDSKFLDYFVFKHTIQRFATDTFSRSQPFWFYVAVLILTAFPWFLMLLGKTKEIFQSPKTKTAFLWAWVIIPVVFFSFSQSKLILYILPVFSGLALGGFAVWESLSALVQRRWERIQSGFQSLALIGLVASPLFDDRIILSYKFIFIWVILVSLLSALRFAGIRRSDRVIVSAWIFTMGLTVMSTYFFSQNPGVTNDTRRVVEWIKENRPEDERIVIYNKRLPSVSFQTSKDIVSIYDGDESLNRETQFQEDDSWKDFLINLKTDPDWIQSPENQQGVWLSKARNKMPLLQNNASWEVLQEIDGWKIMRVKVENR